MKIALLKLSPFTVSLLEFGTISPILLQSLSSMLIFFPATLEPGSTLYTVLPWNVYFFTLAATQSLQSSITSIFALIQDGVSFGISNLLHEIKRVELKRIGVKKILEQENNIIRII